MTRHLHSTSPCNYCEQYDCKTHYRVENINDSIKNMFYKFGIVIFTTWEEQLITVSNRKTELKMKN